MPSNPYPKPAPGTRHHSVVGRVSSADFQYTRQLLPCRNGIQDAIVSTLYKAFIDELRARGLSPSNLDDPAWSVDHPTYHLVDSILRSIQFGPDSSLLERRSSRSPTPIRNLRGRPAGPRDDERGASCVHPAVCNIAGVCTKPESCVEGGRGRRDRESSTEESGEEK